MLAYLVFARPVSERLAWVPLGRLWAVGFHTLVVLCPSAILFREHRLDRLIHHLTTAPWEGGADDYLLARVVVMLVAMLAVIPLGAMVWRDHGKGRLDQRSLELLAAGGLPIALLLIVAFHRGSARDFVYFQF